MIPLHLLTHEQRERITAAGMERYERARRELGDVMFVDELPNVLEAIYAAMHRRHLIESEAS